MGGITELFELKPAPLKFRPSTEGPQIFDGLRKIWLPAKPEELVRQTLIYFMIQVLKYPKGLISQEAPLKRINKKFRADILVRNRVGEPWLLVECKSPKVELTDNTLNQAINYAALSKTQFVAICNSISCVYLKLNDSNPVWVAGLPEFSF